MKWLRNALLNVDMKQLDLDEQIICAIREKGAKEHLSALERSIALQQKRRLRYVAIAASFLLMLIVGFDLKLSSDIKSVGYAFNPVQGQSGGSEITALMDQRSIAVALDKIAEARVLVAEELADPAHVDPEYMAQLDTDAQELDFLEAVCFMRQGKYFKAKKRLKDIADSEGHFSSEAERLLGEL